MLNSLSQLKSGQTLYLNHLYGSAAAYIVAQITSAENRPILLITEDMQQANRLLDEIKQFTDRTISLFTDWETLPYDSFSPHQDIISERLSCLYHLPEQRNGITILPITTLMQRLAPPSFLTGHVFLINQGDHISRESFRSQLENAGYRAVNQVMEHGEFAVRGEIFDLYPMGSDTPFRLDFFDNEIESIKAFDVETQLTQLESTKIELLPAHEFPFDKQGIECFRGNWREKFGVNLEPESLYQQISKSILPGGIEYWLPLFFNEPLATFFDYLSEDVLIITTEEVHSQSEKFWSDLQLRYESRHVDPMRPLVKPNELWLPTQELFEQLNRYPRIVLNQSGRSQKHQINLELSPLPQLAIQSREKDPYTQFETFLEHYLGKVIFSVNSEGRKEALQPILGRIKCFPQSIQTLDEIENSAERYFIMVGGAERGFIDNQRQFALITESELLGERIIKRKKESRSTINSELLIQSLAELTIGKPVVHIEHGIGRYGGLTKLETGGVEGEYLILLYANETKLYVPVSSLNQISRYLGGDEDNAPLNKLGSDAWQKSRNKAAEKIRDVAAELLDIYAERELKPGFAFKPYEEEYQRFCEAFPYQTTDDQEAAINAVLHDMQMPVAMDRLVCGDVGFGKTEVAMRAAFLAVMNGKQVAILVPTTLLAQQHYENFLDRFANWPIHIDSLSRFKTAKQQKSILADLDSGKIDIIIGTHKLLQEEIKWSDLGLLIVDEEHRFGVRQKEKIKALRANIDILTLTATPIPRTLNMAMSGMRDLSIIATPPARRLAVKTFVREYDTYVIKEAILREILRGGQVYFLHNDVASIQKRYDELKELIPEARIAIGHGQMLERELERVMNDFHHQRFNVLLCTTIIETGIDIPNANTIIIERADKFGLAQLHQLRGRVGRSYHQAYAYLLTPSPKTLTKDAYRRLEAISNLEDLGAGFALATHDLEIRGAGELLGDDQSGQIETIGFTLYMEMLDEAVEALKSGKSPTLESIFNQQQTEIELRLPALIPDSYILDVNTRLTLYKRIATTKNEEELFAIRVEMADRFGKLPDPVLFLFEITALRHRAKALGILKIELSAKGGFIEFSEENAVSIDYLIELIQTQPSQFRLEGQNRLKLQRKLTENQQRIDYIKTVLTQFEEHRLQNSETNQK